MTVSRRRLQRGLPWIAVIAVQCAAPASANPIPPDPVFMHVHPFDPAFCESNAITRCDQITQHTTAEGLLEFDLYLLPQESSGLPLRAIHMTLGWPAAWSFQAFEGCNGGAAATQAYPDHADVTIQWETCPPIAGEVFLLGRAILNVSGFGSLAYAGNWPWLDISCPPLPPEGMPLDLAPAQAGVVCSYCYRLCSVPWQPACGSDLSPETLSFEMTQGEAQQKLLQAAIHYVEGYCPGTYTASDPWMTLTVRHVHPWQDEITVRVDSIQLPAGIHEGWVESQSDCVSCTRVTVNVRPVAGIAAPPVTLSSWGRLKGLYR